MKLVSLYIENFGGLHQYALSFNEGLTVLQEPNGFGKTTLAEFIRAMFYGFPRKAKTLDKSRRQKYTPWQGGKFGGNLVFEHEGECYRIERSFGATPKGDSFSLMDLTTNKRSTRFSEEIGLELFQLDADSFERSTYLPQWQDFEGLSTDNIQAKLGNLVEDRGDVGNFDRAVAALKTARSGFIPYRGNGGSVAEAQGQVSRIQGELERTQAQEQSLNREEADISALEIQLEVCKSRKEQLHQKMDAATAAAAVAAAHREYDRLNEEKQQLEADLQQLSSRYPRAIPEDAQIGEARQAAAELAVLAVQQVQTREDQEAAAWLEENGHRFQGHVPTAEELGDCRSRISGYLALERELENTELSEADQAQYEKLLPLWSAGAMEENRLEALDAACRERTKKQHALETIALSDQEKEQMTRLGAYFDSGVPEEAALQQHREKLEQARLLRRENRQKLEELANAPEQGKATGMILCWVLALAGIGTGIWLLAGKLMWGYGALAVGGISLIGALISLVRKVRQDREIRAWEQALREAVAANEARIAALEQAVEAFAARCTALRPLTEALHEIKNNREDLLALGERQRSFARPGRPWPGRPPGWKKPCGRPWARGILTKIC